MIVPNVPKTRKMSDPRRRGFISLLSRNRYEQKRETEKQGPKSATLKGQILYLFYGGGDPIVSL